MIYRSDHVAAAGEILKQECVIRERTRISVSEDDDGMLARGLWRSRQPSNRPKQRSEFATYNKRSGLGWTIANVPARAEEGEVRASLEVQRSAKKNEMVRRTTKK